MRLKLDENLPRDLADALARRGHDVDTVLQEELGGRADPVVVHAATDARRMVMTLDRGVGDIRTFPPGTHAGVVVLRPTSQDPTRSSRWSIACSMSTRSTSSTAAW